MVSGVYPKPFGLGFESPQKQKWYFPPWVGECRERMGLVARLGGWRTCWGRNERWEMGTWVWIMRDMRVERIDRVVSKSGLKNGFNGVDKWRNESSRGDDLDDEADSSLYFTFSSSVTFTTSLSFSATDLLPLSQPPVLSHQLSFCSAMSPLS